MAYLNLLFRCSRFTGWITFTTERFSQCRFFIRHIAPWHTGNVVFRRNDTNAIFYGLGIRKLGMLVPFLFITVACGACSGFHSIVSSGTTSKQIKQESDIRRISYGGMLVEGILAVFAMGCVAVLTMGEREAGGTPVGIFASGASKFFASVGVPPKIGGEFAMLAISTFLLTTLDTCTRLTRFLIEELLSWRNQLSRFGALFGIVDPGHSCLSEISRSGWHFATCLEGDLASFRGNQSITGCTSPFDLRCFSQSK